jgi:spermidine synthase
MALSIIWLFAFQSLYGYVYQRIGWIVALFMAGLVVGCGLVEWWRRKGAPTDEESARLWRRLIAADIAMAFLAAVTPAVLTALGSMQTGPVALVAVDICISALVAVTGVVGGAAFALAAALASRAETRVGASAGRVVGADHLGACLGALLCGILLVPVFGTVEAAIFLAGVKLASAALLIAGKRITSSQLA